MLFEEAWHERQSELLEGQDNSAKRTIRKMEEKVHQRRHSFSFSSLTDAHRTDISADIISSSCPGNTFPRELSVPSTRVWGSHAENA